MFRAGALAILTLSCLYCFGLVVKYLIGDEFVGWNRIILVASVLISAVVCLVMVADAYDFWIRGRSFAIADVRKLQLTALILLGLALSMSALVVKYALFMTIAPAIIIYVMLIVKPTNEAAVAQVKGEKKAQKTAKARRSMSTRGTETPATRQRRGGRKTR